MTKKIMHSILQKKVAKKAVKKAAPRKPAKKTAAPKKAVIRTLRETVPVPEKNTLDTLYIVNDTPGPVRVAVEVGGPGQTSNMTIKLDGNILAQDISGNFPDTIIGTNANLDGKKLTIAATIADTSRETNFTSLTIHLKGGVTNADFPLAKTVDAEGDSADYACVIEFFNPM